MFEIFGFDVTSKKIIYTVQNPMNVLAQLVLFTSSCDEIFKNMPKKSVSIKYWRIRMILLLICHQNSGELITPCIIYLLWYA